MLDVADALEDLAEQDASQSEKHPAAAALKVTLDDIKILIDAESVDLPAALTTYLQEPDVEPEPKPEGYINTATLRGMIASARRKRRKQQRKEATTDAWKKFMQQKVLPERMQLADLVTGLDDKGTEAARSLIIQIAKDAPHDVGLWGGIKRVWKRAEERHDHVLWAALSAAIEQKLGTGAGFGTQRYVGRRAWRYLRDLGRGAPELFPHVAVELLQHYERWGTVVSQVSAMREPDPLFLTWKTSPEPLLRLLESALSETTAKFAVDTLKKFHGDVLRSLEPKRLARLVERELMLTAVHELFLEIVEKSAGIPLAKLREAGLHDAAIRLLFSPSQRARTWAVEYARAHARDLPADKVIELVERGQGEAQKLGVSLLEPMPASSFDLAVLARLLHTAVAAPLADKKLRERIAALDETSRVQFLVDRVFASDAQRNFANTVLAEKIKANEPWAHEVWLRVLEDSRAEWQQVAAALNALASVNHDDPLAVLDASRLIDFVAHKPDHAQQIGMWFERATTARNLDVERVKGLVFPSKTRQLALQILGNRRLVKPMALGLSWLLALAKRADVELHRFAYATLLEHTKPDDFTGASSSGVDRLFEMATGAGESDATRAFAQTYLRCHHPLLGPLEAQAKQLGLAPQLSRDVYTLARVWSSLFDPREDVRRFAAAITRVELRRWGAQKRLHELCESDDKGVRNIALDAMLKAGDPSADPEATLTLDELDAEAIFPLTESIKKSVRDTGMELIRRHYTRLGGVERLSWLMQSADREVRLFAVRLLWEKHRPRATPASWRPRKNAHGAEVVFDDAGRFADGVAMRGFLRRVMFALPPGASADGGDDAKVRKHVPASVAKRQLVEVVRDVAVADAGFALLVRPVLLEMTGSLARGEWQACLAAIATIDKAHAVDVTATATATMKGGAA